MPLPQTNIIAFTGMDAPTRDDPDNFDPRAEDAWKRLKAGEGQFNTLATQTNAMATAANASASAASQSAIDAQGYRNEANGAKVDAVQAKTDAQAAKALAETARDAAQGFADNASNSAAAAAAAALALVATSTSAVTIGTGAKVFTIPAGKLLSVGVPVFAVNPADPTKYIAGTVASYVGTTLTINATRSGGAGSVSNWNISVAGEQGNKGDKGDKGDTGGIAGGAMTDALWQKKGIDVASAASPAVWAAGGNYFTLTGNATMTAFPAAPQAGAQFRALVSGSPSITASANLVVKGLASGSTHALGPGDELEVTADSTTKFYVKINKADSTPVKGGLTLLAVLTPVAAAALDALNVFSASYDDYLIMVDGLSPASGESALNLRVAVAGSLDSSSSYWGETDNAASNAVSASYGSIMNGRITVQRANDAAMKTLECASMYLSASQYRSDRRWTAYVGSSAISGFRLYWASGANFLAQGRVRIYGFQKG